MKTVQCIIVVFLLFSVQFTQTASSENFQLVKQVVDNSRAGIEPPQSEGFELSKSSMGNTGSGQPESDNYNHSPGFLVPQLVLLPGCTDPVAVNYNPTAGINDGSCEYGMLGDLDNNTELNVVDIIIIVGIIIDGSESEFQLWAADFNADGEVNVVDIVEIVGIILMG